MQFPYSFLTGSTAELTALARTYLFAYAVLTPRDNPDRDPGSRRHQLRHRAYFGLFSGSLLALLIALFAF